MLLLCYDSWSGSGSDTHTDTGRSMNTRTGGIIGGGVKTKNKRYYLRPIALCHPYVIKKWEASNDGEGHFYGSIFIHCNDVKNQNKREPNMR